MTKQFDKRNLAIFSITPYTQIVKAQLKSELKKHKESRFEMIVNNDDPEVDGTYTVQRSCPIKSNLCEWQPNMMEGMNCAFYNGYKKKCVFPRTVRHNPESEHFLNLYDRFSGNINRYCVPEEKKAKNFIEQKLTTLGLSCDDWAYVEFDDNGKEVRLAEMGTNEDISKIREQEEQIEQKRYDQMLVEFKDLRKKYEGNLATLKDLEKVIQLTKELSKRRMI